MTQSTSDDPFKDSLNFVKNLWGKMGVPGMMTPSMPTIPGIGMPIPTMSIEELDKRIQELKSVESWLNVNITMLRSTIQALEIQRATIATLHSLSATMAQTMQGADLKTVEVDEHSSNLKENNASSDISPLISQSAAWWNSVQEQFKQALGTALENSKTNYGISPVEEAAKEEGKHTKVATTKAVRKSASSARGRKGDQT